MMIARITNNPILPHQQGVGFQLDQEENIGVKTSQKSSDRECCFLYF